MDAELQIKTMINVIRTVAVRSFSITIIKTIPLSLFAASTAAVRRRFFVLHFSAFSRPLFQRNLDGRTVKTLLIADYRCWQRYCYVLWQQSKDNRNRVLFFHIGHDMCTFLATRAQDVQLKNCNRKFVFVLYRVAQCSEILVSLTSLIQST